MLPANMRRRRSLATMQWVVRVAPEDGWSSPHYQGLLAGVVVLAVVVSGALFAALVMWWVRWDLRAPHGA